MFLVCSHSIGSLSAVCHVKVEDVYIDSIELVGPVILPRINMQENLAPNITPGDATEKIIWMSEDPTVVRVSERGMAWAVSEGETTITARSEKSGKKESVKVYVGKLPANEDPAQNLTPNPVPPTPVPPTPNPTTAPRPTTAPTPKPTAEPIPNPTIAPKPTAAPTPTIIPIAKPSAPTATALSKGISLAWKMTPNASSYSVYKVTGKKAALLTNVI